VLAPDKEISVMSAWVKELAAQRKVFAERLADRKSVRVPAEDPDFEDIGRAWPSWSAGDKDAILQPPKPMIKPSPRVLERAGDREMSPR
jgi:hypothetical protein